MSFYLSRLCTDTNVPSELRLTPLHRHRIESVQSGSIPIIKSDGPSALIEMFSINKQPQHIGARTIRDDDLEMECGDYAK